MRSGVDAPLERSFFSRTVFSQTTVVLLTTKVASSESMYLIEMNFFDRRAFRTHVGFGGVLIEFDKRKKETVGVLTTTASPRGYYLIWRFTCVDLRCFSTICFFNRWQKEIRKTIEHFEIIPYEVAKPAFGQTSTYVVWQGRWWFFGQGGGDNEFQRIKFPCPRWENTRMLTNIWKTIAQRGCDVLRVSIWCWNIRCRR